MTQKIASSNGALRAAATIVADMKVGFYREFGGKDPRKADSDDTKLVIGIAKIIDREAGLAELLEVAKETLKWLKAIHNWENMNIESGHFVMEALQQAVAKAERKL